MYDLYPSDGVVCCRTWVTEGAMKLTHFDSTDLNNDLSSTRRLNYIHIYLDIASIYLNQIKVPKNASKVFAVLEVFIFTE